VLFVVWREIDEAQELPVSEIQLPHDLLVDEVDQDDFLPDVLGRRVGNDRVFAVPSVLLRLQGCAVNLIRVDIAEGLKFVVLTKENTLNFQLLVNAQGVSNAVVRELQCVQSGQLFREGFLQRELQGTRAYVVRGNLRGRELTGFVLTLVLRIFSGKFA